MIAINCLLLFSFVLIKNLPVSTLKYDEYHFIIAIELVPTIELILLHSHHSPKLEIRYVCVAETM